MLLASAELDRSGHGTAERKATLLADGAVLVPSIQLDRAQTTWRRSLPFTALPDSFFPSARQRIGILGIAADLQGDIYFGLEASYPAEAPEAARDDGFIIRRSFRLPTQPTGDLASTEAGTLLAVDVAVNARADASHVAIEIPLPAGLEAVDPELPTQALGIPVAAVVHQDFCPAHSELLPDKTKLFLRHVSAGEARFTFFARAQIPGRLALPGAQVEAMYLPELRGRSDARTFTVRPLPPPGP